MARVEMTIYGPLSGLHGTADAVRREGPITKCADKDILIITMAEALDAIE